MTLDTVTNYFLVAGASFRNSDVWKRQHVDEHGRSRVLRGGRFGVGALAAFLLGDEIKVRTRHVDRSENDGLEFTARMDDPIVELRRCPAPVGTEIAVWISDPKVFDDLRPYVPLADTTGHDLRNPISLKDWPKVDWFAQSRPRVKYFWNGFDVQKGRSDRKPVQIRAEFCPTPDDVLPVPEGPIGEWHSLPEPTPYTAILWRYNFVRKEIRKEDTEEQVQERLARSEVTVNGIRVQHISRYSDSGLIKVPEKVRGLEPLYTISRPSIAVFDPSGMCPINLQRSAVAFDRMGIDDLLAADVLADHVNTLVTEARTCLSLSDFQEFCKRLDKQQTVTYDGQLSPVCVTARGITLSAVHAFVELGINVLFFVDPGKSVASALLKDILQHGEALLIRQGGKGVNSDLSWFRGIFSGNSWYSTSAGFPLIPHVAVSSCMPNKKWRAANEKGKVNRQILGPLQHEDHKKGYAAVTTGDASAAKSVMQRLDTLLNVFGDDAGVSAWVLDQNMQLAQSPAPLYSAWLAAAGGPI